jgi:hypothetical protein
LQPAFGEPTTVSAELLTWDALSPVFDAFYKAHVEYEKDKGDLKFLTRNKRQLLFLTNDDVQEEGAGGLSRRTCLWWLTNVQTKYDQAAPFIQKINASWWAGK